MFFKNKLISENAIIQIVFFIQTTISANEK